MSSSRDIVIFDVETTGTDKRQDQVIELCVQFGLGHEHKDAETQSWRFRPTAPMSPGAQAVHGISTDDLADCPSFSEYAEALRPLFERARVLVGYNVGFDIDMVQAEYARLKIPPLNLQGKMVVDAFRMWQQCEPRSLQDAHRRFVGAEFSAAHSATADVAATGRVLAGMVRAFGLPLDWEALARVCEPARDSWVGPSRHVVWDRAGRPAIGFGKHAGTPILELIAGPDRGYLEWIVGKDFPTHVRDIAARALSREPADFLAWVHETFGEAPSGPDEANTADTATANPGVGATAI